MDNRLEKQLKYLKFDDPTAIQKSSYDALLNNPKDAFIRSITGSGKTLAFLVPAINYILKADTLSRESTGKGLSRDDGTRILIISPTRELTVQTQEVAEKLTQMIPSITVTSLVCGTNRKSEKAALRKGVTILLATPGRILDHLDTTSRFRCQHLSCIIMDEADRLLDLGFESKLKRIITELKKRKVEAPIILSQIEAEDKPFKSLSTDMLAAEREVQRAMARALLRGEITADEEPTSSQEIKDEDVESEDSTSKKRATPETGSGAQSAAKRSSAPQQTVLEMDEDDEEDGIAEIATIAKKEDIATAASSDEEKSHSDSNDDDSESSDGDSAEETSDKEDSSDEEESEDSTEGEAFDPAALGVVLVSATLTSAIQKLASFCLSKDAVWICAKKDEETAKSVAEGEDVGSNVEGSGEPKKVTQDKEYEVPESVKQACIKVTNLKMKLLSLFALLKMRTENKKKTLVFVNHGEGVDFLHALMEALKWPCAPDNTRRDEREKRSKMVKQVEKFADKLKATHGDIETENGDDIDDLLFNLTEPAKTTLFTDERVFQGIKAFKIHGDMSKDDRIGNMRDFGVCPEAAVLITTDVAARGLNLPKTDLVIQFEAPVDVTDYVHRIGRTGRMGAKGTSVVFLQDHELGYLDELFQRGAAGGVAIKQTADDTLLDLYTPVTAKSKKSLLPAHLSKLRAGDSANFILARFTMFSEEEPSLSALAQKAYLAALKTYRVQDKRFFDATKLHLGHLAGSYLIKRSPAEVAKANFTAGEGRTAFAQNSFRGRGGSSHRGGDRPFRGGDRPFRGGDRPFRGGDRPFRGGDRPFRGGDRPSRGGSFREGDRPFRGGDRSFRGGDRSFRGGSRGGFRGGDRGGDRKVFNKDHKKTE